MSAQSAFEEALGRRLQSERRETVKRIQHAVEQTAKPCPPQRLTDPVGMTWSSLIQIFDAEWNR